MPDWNLALGKTSPTAEEDEATVEIQFTEFYKEMTGILGVAHR